MEWLVLALFAATIIMFIIPDKPFSQWGRDPGHRPEGEEEE